MESQEGKVSNNKCIILTPCTSVSGQDIVEINKANIFKIAVNNANYPSNVRLFHDFVYSMRYVSEYPEPLITSSYALNSLITKDIISNIKRFVLFYKTVKQPNTESSKELYFETGSLIPAIDYAIKQEYFEILIVGDNTVHGDYFTRQINRHIKRFNGLANLYQSQKWGKFELPYKSVADFVSY